MITEKNMQYPPRRELLKTLTGNQGLDEITEGGLPKGRPTLVVGGPGCGKTLLAIEFIVKGITDFDENGVFVSFEESRIELVENVASLGFDLDVLMDKKQLFIDEIRMGPPPDIEAGQSDLGGLFARLQYGIDTVGAKRIVIDDISSLFSYISNQAILRSELHRLFDWLKEKGLTAIITAESGGGTNGLTRNGIEEYVSDCVILLDQRIQEQVKTRRLNILKYRGSRHGTNEYPFLITENGISVLPITSMLMNYNVSTERVSTGIQKLDDMFGGKGYLKGNSILISGTAGTGKSSFGAHFAHSVCASGNRCLYFAFEESADQIVRNMRSIGVDLKPHVDENRLQFHAVRPTIYGLEMHLLNIHRMIENFKPDAVIIDPLSNLTSIGSLMDIKLLFLRILDFLKRKQITTLCTDLTSGGSYPEATDVGVSSIMDTWILLRNEEKNGNRERSIYILKSRGMAHSNQIHLFDITDNKIVLQDIRK
jgi:circadian clock protein KaiC